VQAGCNDQNVVPVLCFLRADY